MIFSLKKPGSKQMLLFLFPMIFPLLLHAQEKPSFESVDTKTYQYYLEGKWDSLLSIGKNALENNIDYFYLRVRMGAAYYSKKNYAKAIIQFEKATKFNSSDTYTQEMLYYSYLFSGRDADAKLFGSRMGDLAKKETGFKKHDYLNSVYLEGGTKINDNFSKNENINFYGESKIYGEADLSGNSSFSQLGLRHNIGRRFSVYHGVSYLNENKEKIIQNAEMRPYGFDSYFWDTIYFVPPPPANGHYNHDTIITHIQKLGRFDTVLSAKYNLKQLDYYINCRIFLGKGYTLTPAFHLINVEYTMLNATYQKLKFNAVDTQFIHTQIVVPKPPPNPPYYVIKDTGWINTIVRQDSMDEYKYYSSDTTFNNYVVALALNKDYKKISAGIFASYSNLNGRKQKYGGLSLVYYPKGNLNLYAGGTLTASLDKKEKSLVYTQKIGTKLFSFLWLEGNATIGKMSNFVESNGFIAHNNPDDVLFRCGLTPIFVFKKFDISLHYQYLQSEARYITYTTPSSIETRICSYESHLIVAGIKWKL